MIEKNAIPTSHADDGRKPRSDGEQSRERLLHSAIRLFAEQGYAKTSTRHVEGAGLGLYLCQNLANAIGGALFFNSDYGSGSTFTLALRSKS